MSIDDIADRVNEIDVEKFAPTTPSAEILGYPAALVEQNCVVTIDGANDQITFSNPPHPTVAGESYIQADAETFIADVKEWQ